MKKLRHIYISTAVSLSTLISPVFADTLQTPLITLDKALRAAPADSQVTIAVQADTYAISVSHPVPGKDEPISEIARDFGMSAKTFGSVRSVTSPVMYRYNETPEDPDPFDGMTPQEIVKRFAATLDDTQWHLFTGQHGIGLPDLKSGLQRALFLALFPAHEIHAAPDKPLTEDDIRKRLAAGTATANISVIDLTPQLSGARLRLGLRTELSLAGSDAARSSQPARLAVPGAPQYFVLATPSSPNTRDRLFGITFREMVPITSKAGELDWSLPALQRKIAVDKDKTVGDLINHVSAATGLEIIAGHSIEGQPLTIAGGNTPGMASDLLQAIAYSVKGTYRRVGSAYLLTSDLTGQNVLRQRWVEAEESVNRLRREDQAVQNTATRRLEDLSMLSGALTPTDAQRNAWLHPSANTTATLFKELTPDEQQTVKTQLEARKLYLDVLKTQHPELATTLSVPPAITPETQIDGAIHVDLEADVPALPGPVAFDLGPHLDDTLAVQQSAATSGTAAPKVMLGDKLPKGAEAADLPTIVRRFPRRAVQAQPQTMAEVDAIIASMQKLGFNELWLDVFSGGKARTAIAGVPGDTAADILGEALRIGPKAGIRVLPTADLYLWAGDVPETARDLNVYGEDSLEAFTHQIRIYDDPGSEVENADTPRKLKPGSIFVDPSAPAIQSRLEQLLRSLASQPGIDGMVWRETDPPGYSIFDRGSDSTILDLGYTTEMRLAFLRKSHIDPIDILPASYAKADQFLARTQDNPAGEMDAAWRSMLGDTDHANLRALYDTTQKATGGHRLSIFLRQAGYDDGGTGWYGVWDDPSKPVPAYHSPNKYIAELSTQPRPGPWVVQAKSQSKTALYLVPPSASRDAGKLAADLTAHVQGKAWDGFVVDLRRDSIAYQDTNDYPADPVAALMIGK